MVINSMYLLCAVCGTEHRETGKFCSNCGGQKFVSQDPDKSYLSPGDVIASRYEIIAFLQKGGMGAVYKAEDRRLSKICAVKELINTSFDKKEKELAVMRFEREAKILSELSHTNLPRVIDYFTIGDRHYLAMDFIDGTDLSDLLERPAGSEGFSEEEVADWALQICDVLIYLHSRNPPVVYRDIKPSNIMLRESDGKLMLIDFGIARTIASKDDRSLTKTAIGTMGYMAPEQYRGGAEVRSDIYSLGATMYHLLTGKSPLPFNIRPLDSIRSDISNQLNAVVMTAVRMKRSERFQSAEEMKRAIMGNLKLKVPVTEEVAQVDMLINQLESSEPDLRYIVLRAVENYVDNNKVKGALVKTALNDPDLIVRREAVDILSRIKDEKALTDVFCKILFDEDREIKIKAIRFLREAKEPSSCSFLKKVLLDEDNDVALSAAFCLSEMNNESALDDMFSLLEKQTSPDKKDELEKAINRVNSSYLNQWRRKRESEKIQKEEKKGIYALVYVAIFIVIASAAYISYSYISKQVKVAALTDEGIAFFKHCDYPEAMESFNKALELSPDSSEIMYWLGRTYIYLEPKKADFYLDQALSINPDYGEALMAKGKSSLKKGNPEEAIDYLEKALDLKKDLPPAYIYLGEAYYKAGNREKAKELFENYKALFPDEEELNKMAISWQKKIAAGEVSPEITQKVNNILSEGKLLMEQMDYTGASNKFQEAISISPDDGRGYFWLGKTHLLQRNKDMALTYLKKAMECDPLYGEALCNIALIYIREKNYKEAIKYLVQASDMEPNFSDTYYLMGQAYYEGGDNKKAVESFENYLNTGVVGEKADEVRNIIQRLESER